MKKIFKVSLLLLAAVMFFAGCQKETPEPEKDKIELSDGIWHVDIVSTATLTSKNHEVTTTQREHIEMQISGDDIDIITAIISVDGYGQADITDNLKNTITSKSELENPEKLKTNNSNTSTTPQIDTSAIKPEYTFEKNDDGTLYKITTHLSYKYADICDAQTIAYFETMGIDTQAPCTNDWEVIYKKISD